MSAQWKRGLTMSDFARYYPIGTVGTVPRAYENIFDHFLYLYDKTSNKDLFLNKYIFSNDRNSENTKIILIINRYTPIKMHPPKGLRNRSVYGLQGP
jgi:hypothetical protein